MQELLQEPQNLSRSCCGVPAWPITFIPANATIKSIKAGDARHRLADGAGPYLRLFVNGGSHGWRFDCSVKGRRNTLSLGTMSVPTWASSHSSKIIRRLEQDVFPWIGAKPISTIRPTELLSLLRRVEERGTIKTTHRVQQNCGQVFRYAVATGRFESDPSRDLRGALTPWKPEHYPTLTDARELGRLLRDIEGYEGGFITKCAMTLSPMLFVRPGELRRAEWIEINLDAAERRIPAAKMKAERKHRQCGARAARLRPHDDHRTWISRHGIDAAA